MSTKNPYPVGRVYLQVAEFGGKVKIRRATQTPPHRLVKYDGDAHNGQHYVQAYDIYHYSDAEGFALVPREVIHYKDAPPVIGEEDF